MNTNLQSSDQLHELREMIRGVCLATTNITLRQKAFKAIQWRLRGPNGEFIGLKNLRSAFVPEAEAMIFDARDNEALKLRIYQATLGPLVIEILPQIP